MITYSPGFQQDQSNALLRHSYLAPKKRNGTYDQQHSILLKPERLLLRTLHTTTSVDSTFSEKIHINLFLDPLALNSSNHVQILDIKMIKSKFQIFKFQTHRS
jgi:hypothetical protein